MSGRRRQQRNTERQETQGREDGGGEKHTAGRKRKPTQCKLVITIIQTKSLDTRNFNCSQSLGSICGLTHAQKRKKSWWRKEKKNGFRLRFYRFMDRNKIKILLCSGRCYILVYHTMRCYGTVWMVRFGKVGMVVWYHMVWFAWRCQWGMV